MKPARRRFAFRALLALPILALACLALRRPPDERLRSSLSLALAGATSIDESISLVEPLKYQGDERGVRELSEQVLADPALTPVQAGRLADVVFNDVFTWNESPPAWKLKAVARWRELGSQGASQHWERLIERVPVSLSFAGPGGRSGKLYAEGNWSSDGRMSDLEGWKDEPMRREGGRWVLRKELVRSRFRALYRVQLRDAPWPKGRVVAEADFSADIPKTEVKLKAAAPLRSAEKLPPLPDGPPATELGIAMLDGAAWRLLLPLIRRGELPHFQALLEQGAFGTLTASRLHDSGPESFTNVYSAFTGKLPFRHGMNGHLLYEKGRLASPLWVMVSDAGRRAAAVNIEGNFPMDGINGVEVPEAFFAVNAEEGARADLERLAMAPSWLEFARGFGATGEEMKEALKDIRGISRWLYTTTPHDLAAELARALPPAALREAAALQDAAATIERQVQSGAAWVLGRQSFDLLCVWTLSTDSAGHFHWGQLEPAAQPFPPGLPADERRELSRYWKEDESQLLDSYKRADWLVGLLMRRCRHVIVFSDHGFGADPGYQPSLQLDMGKVSALFPGEKPVVDGAGLRFKDRRGAEDFARFLRTARFVPSRRPVFSSAAAGEDGVVAAAPAPGEITAVELGGRKRHVAELFEFVPLQGVHMVNGVVALWGEGVKPGAMTGDLYTADIAPTALYLLGLPAARDMDGRLMEGAFTAERLRERPETWKSSYGGGGWFWWKLLRAVRW